MYKQLTQALSKSTQPVSLVAALLLVALPTIVSAQDDVLEEILVTATRRAMSVQDIPYNISAMTGDQLESAGVFSLADLSRAIPGIAYSDLGVRSSGVNNQLILRGLNANAQGSIGAYITNLTPAGVSTYMDDTPLFTNLRMNDLERVELLRGPQGTLYGAGSVGGTLRFIFNKPDPEEFSAKLNTGIGTTEDADDLNYGVDGVINIPLGTTAALRISAGYEETAGFTDGKSLAVGGISNPQIADPTDPFGTPLATEVREDTDDADQWYLRASLLWKMGERFEAQFTYHRQEDDGKGLSAQTNSGVPGAEERTHDQFFNGPLSREVDLFSLDLEFDLGFARLESATSYTKNKARNIGDLTGLALINDIFAGGFAFGGYPATNGRLASYYDEFYDEKSVVQEIRLISTGEDKLDWIAGFYYQDIDVDSFETIYVPGFANYANTPGHPFTAFLPVPPFLSWANLISGPPGFVSQAAVDSEIFFISDRRDGKIEDIAIFGELTYHATDAWQVTVGGRVFWNEDTRNLISTFPLFGAISAQDGLDPTGLNQASGKENVQDHILKVNTSYEFSEDLMAYFTWAEGFRRGGSNAFPLTGFNAEDPSQLTFQSDTVSNYEIGVKGVLFEQLRYTAAIYRVDWDNPQIAGTFLPSGFAAVFNADEARTQGIELEGHWSITDALRITAGYTYTDAELTKDFATPLGPSDFVPDSSGSDGNRMPGVPESMATWALDYEHPVNFPGDSLIHFRVDGSYRSSVVTAPSPTTAQYAQLDGFDIWNVSVTWSNNHWRVGAFVKNIGDEIGITQVVRDFVIARPVEAVDLVSRPRTIGVTVGYTY